jgi:sugar diacid utilization regulator
VAARGGDLVAIVGGSWPRGQPFGGVSEDLASPEDWWAVSGGPASIETLAEAYATALDALRVVPIVAQPRSITTAHEVALERSLVADPVLAGQGARRWLDPLESAGRGAGRLVPTLEAWLASGQSVVATARVLGVAPRTVSYRLDRIARLFGERELGPRLRERLTVALLIRRLLAPS